MFGSCSVCNAHLICLIVQDHPEASALELNVIVCWEGNYILSSIPAGKFCLTQSNRSSPVHLSSNFSGRSLKPGPETR